MAGSAQVSLRPATLPVLFRPLPWEVSGHLRLQMAAPLELAKRLSVSEELPNGALP